MPSGSAPALIATHLQIGALELPFGVDDALAPDATGASSMFCIDNIGINRRIPAPKAEIVMRVIFIFAAGPEGS